MRRPVVWIPIAIIIVLIAVFHDSPLVLSLWHVLQALWNVLDAINSKLVKTPT